MDLKFRANPSVLSGVYRMQRGMHKPYFLFSVLVSRRASSLANVSVAVDLCILAPCNGL
jgi:hypothetical protein